MILEIEEEENYKTREKQRQGGISTSLEQAQLALGQKRDAVSCTQWLSHYCIAPVCVLQSFTRAFALHSM